MRFSIALLPVLLPLAVCNHLLGRLLPWGAGEREPGSLKIRYDELLPDELLVKILETNHIAEMTKGKHGNALRPRDLARCERVSKRWQRIVRDTLHLSLSFRPRELEGLKKNDMIDLTIKGRQVTVEASVCYHVEDFFRKKSEPLPVFSCIRTAVFLSEIQLTRCRLDYNVTLACSPNLKMLRCSKVEFFNARYALKPSSLKYLELYYCSYPSREGGALKALFCQHYRQIRLPDLTGLAIVFGCFDTSDMSEFQKIVPRMVKLKHYLLYGEQWATPAFVQTFQRISPLKSVGLAHVNNWNASLEELLYHQYTYEYTIDNLTIVLYDFWRAEELSKALISYIGRSKLCTLTLVLPFMDVRELYWACQRYRVKFVHKWSFNLIQFWELGEPGETFYFRKGSQEDMASLEKREFQGKWYS